MWFALHVIMQRGRHGCCYYSLQLYYTMSMQAIIISFPNVHESILTRPPKSLRMSVEWERHWWKLAFFLYKSPLDYTSTTTHTYRSVRIIKPTFKSLLTLTSFWILLNHKEKTKKKKSNNFAEKVPVDTHSRVRSHCTHKVVPLCHLQLLSWLLDPVVFVMSLCGGCELANTLKFSVQFVSCVASCKRCY